MEMTTFSKFHTESQSLPARPRFSEMLLFPLVGARFLPGQESGGANTGPFLATQIVLPPMEITTFSTMYKETTHLHLGPHFSKTLFLPPVGARFLPREESARANTGPRPATRIVLLPLEITTFSKFHTESQSLHARPRLSEMLLFPLVGARFLNLGISTRSTFWQILLTSAGPLGGGQSVAEKKFVQHLKAVVNPYGHAPNVHF